MGKRGYQGESPADRSINFMEKFIKRSERKQQLTDRLPARRKAKDVPMDLWPLKDQLEYWDNLSDADWFDRKYSHYMDWFDKVEELSNQYPTTFRDQIIGHKERIREVYDQKIKPMEALRILRKEGIIWV